MAKKNKSVVRADKYKDKEYMNVYRKVRYRVSKVNELNSEAKRGYKTKRSEIYKEIVGLNKKLISISRKKGYLLPSGKRKSKSFKEVAKIKERKFDEAQGTITYSATVWQFEDRLKDYLIARTFNRIYFKNLGKSHYIKISRLSTILGAYDEARNEAYGRKLATTPLVEVTEDYENSTLTLYFVS